ncbi:MAG: hypothetical protein EZS28_045989, partial [Streblomastix strix]
DGDVQDIQGILRKTTLDQPYPEPTDDDYITLGAVKSEFVSSIYSGSINGNLTANQFIKSYKDDTSVLLAGGGDRLLSSFGGIEDLTSSAFSANGGNYNAGTFNPDYLVQDDVAVITYIPFPNITVDKGVYIGEALLVAAGLMDFPELYAYIKERDPKPPIETAPPVPAGEQTLQEQMKINAEILENTNEVFVPPEPKLL